MSGRRGKKRSAEGCMNLAEMLTTRYSYSYSIRIIKFIFLIFFLRSGKRSRSDAPTISLSPSDALCHESTSNDVSVGETNEFITTKLF